MAIAVRANSTAGGASGGNVTANKPTGTVDNDILIAHLYTESGSTAWTLPAGWAWVLQNQRDNNANYWHSVAWKRASSEGASWTFSHSPSAWRDVVVVAWSGAITSGDPQDSTAVGKGIAGTTVTVTTITNASANSMNIASAQDFSGADIGVASSGYTDYLYYDDCSVFYNLQASSGASGDKTFGTANSGEWSSVHLSIKEAPTTTLEQEGFRFGVDDGNEAAHGWEAAQDTNITTAAAVTKLLRLLINSTGDYANAAYKLKFAKNGGAYGTVATSATSAGTTPVIEAADATQSGNDTASGSWALSTPNASTGDLLIFCLSWDDSTATTDVTEPAGKASETLLEVNATPATDASTETRSKVWYCICAGSWTAGTITFTPAASESWTGACIRVPAGEFDSTTPIGASDTEGAAGTAEANIQHGAFSAGASDGNGKLCVWTSADVDPQTVASGFTQVANTDRGTVSGGFFTRDTAVSDSESFSAITVSTIASDSWSTVSFVVRAPVVTNDLYVSTSANIAAGGEATTARLTAPSGKTTSDFVTGRRWDNENGSDSIDITTDDYTELEWCLTLRSGLSAADYFDFRVYNADAAIDTYTTTPRWTIEGAATVYHNLMLLGVGG